MANPTYNGSDGGRIDLVKAREWAQNHRNTNPAALRSHYFGREILDQILQQRGCTGIRLFYALDDKQARQLLIAGVDAQGNTQLPASPGITPGDFSILDFSFPCPPVCPPGSDL